MLRTHGWKALTLVVVALFFSVSAAQVFADHPPPPPPGNEGCTPGFWKNHLTAWVGFSPGQTVEDVFNVPDAFGLDSDTLEEALSYGGGPNLVGAARILLRAAVAAVLNAASPDVDYPRTVAQVQTAVNDALNSGSRGTMISVANQLDVWNNLGAPPFCD